MVSFPKASSHPLTDVFHWQDWPEFCRTALRIVVLMVLLALGTLIVYATGGTRYAYSYLMLLPVLLGASWYGMYGALLVALAAGWSMAAMPLDVSGNVSQDTASWLVRLTMYLLIGGFSGFLFSRLRHTYASREALMRTDPGSGLPNRVALQKHLSHALKTASLKAQVGIVLVRLVDITDVLEAMGMDASDELVAEIGRRFDQFGSQGVGIYRFSGAELAVVVSGVDRACIKRMAQRLIDLGEENIIVRGVPVRVQLVMGSSLSPQDSLSAPGELLRQARIALFSATEKQRSHCHYDSSLTQRSMETITLISQVRTGLELKQFELHFQPKVRLADGHVCGNEGLIRWRNKNGELLAPGMFMPKVENTTLISPVTHFVIGEACQFALEHEGVISINFSMRNLLDDDLLDELEALVKQLGLAPSRLEIEITESALMLDMVATKRALERLRRFGFGVSIDDFGTGFSSFEYLQYLPITGLKIDKAFIGDLAVSERSRKLVACLINVGHALELEVTAEGVETLAQHRALRELGCDQAQGFLYSRALPAKKYRHWCDAYGERRESLSV
ncbi:bifunctional diguanylate cyclase/phosphodiesterase [Vreelandella rituensis]|uniref:EAL domain-containing protein n=1 Tax=Vreelandella rituensis TaxID=2282306 RepID=A0A368UBY4_9GAMM|nr:bifunctional diguanylate cyclase/phosphodiesterase [Halomonas rituensis]RCV92953.1 EAL domain-containing protein [Halomonas rituensis]